MATIYAMPAIYLDPNGLPRGHKQAMEAAAREFSDYINELPEWVAYMGPSDAELGAVRVIERYLITLRRSA